MRELSIITSNNHPSNPQQPIHSLRLAPVNKYMGKIGKDNYTMEDEWEYQGMIWYNVRPPLDSVQLVNITPMSLWFMVFITN